MNEQAPASRRFAAIDSLRGTVMVVMALDHVRDFVHADAALFSPTDLAKTSAILFFTRWITHFCMPVFMFLAGTGAFFYGQRRKNLAELRRFLWKRGLWFIFLEFTVMQFAYNFNFSRGYIVSLLILWIFGLCFLCLALLARVPVRWLLPVSLVVIVLHNGLDYLRLTPNGVASTFVAFLHLPNFFTLGGFRILISYPPIPWLAVMAAGYCFGEVCLLEPARRQRILLIVGLSMTASFIFLRAINVYGDPAPWSHQPSAAFTLLSFLNTTKYPPSLEFLLMTLAPAFLLLSLYDRFRWIEGNPLLVFGRVPLFYFIGHFFAIHVLVVILAFVRYGGAARAFVFNPVPAMGGPQQLFPPDFGYSLWVVYACWIGLVIALYPCCRWFARIKATYRAWWLSYL